MKKIYSLVSLLFVCLLANAQFRMNSVSLMSSSQPVAVKGTIPDESVPVGYCSSFIDDLGAVGIGGEATLSAAIQLPVSDIKSKGDQIFMIKFALGSDDARDAEVFLSQDLTGTPLLTQPVSDAHSGWNYVVLSTPKDLSSLEGDLYVGYSVKTAGYTMGIETLKNANKLADWMAIDGEWSNLSSVQSIGACANTIQILVSGGDYSSETQLGVVAAELDFRKYVATNQNIKAQCEIRNVGVKTIKDMVLSYKVGDQTKSLTLDGLNIANAVGQIIELPEVSLASDGTYSIEVKAASLNGQSNLGLNEAATGEIIVLQEGTFVDRQVLIEQFTGQYCGYCPAGHTAMKAAVKGYEDRVSWVSHYSYDGTDGEFYIPENNTIARAFGVGGAPYCMLDRTNIKNYSSTSSPIFNTQLMTPQCLRGMVENPAYVSVDLAGILDKEQNAIEVTITGEFLKEYPNAKLNVFLVEDGFNTFQYQSALMPNYPHDHVMRAVISKEVMGDDLVVENNKFQKKYAYVIPAKIAKMATNLENMRVIAFVADYVKGQKNKCIVHNSVALDLNDFTEGSVSNINNNILNTLTVSAENGMVFVNGEYDSFDVYATDGMKINNQHISSGIYIVKIFIGKSVVVKKIVID